MNMQSVLLAILTTAAALRHDHVRNRRRRAEAKAFVAEMDRCRAEIDHMLAELEATRSDEHEVGDDAEPWTESNNPDWWKER